MKRVAILFLSIILVLTMTEFRCENSSENSDYPYISSLPRRGNRGSVSITTVEHGSTFERPYTGTGIVKNQKCYSTAGKANEEPIQIDSRGHEIIITMSYEDNTESFTLNAGESKLLSIQRRSYLTDRAYIYVIVT